MTSASFSGASIPHTTFLTLMSLWLTPSSSVQMSYVHHPYPHAHAAAASVISTDDNGKERKEFLCCFSERVEGAAMSMGSVRVRGWVPFRDNQRKLGLSVDW